jgi:hypothetical protein
VNGLGGEADPALDSLIVDGSRAKIRRNFFWTTPVHRFAYSKGQLANGVTTLAGFFSRNRSHPIDRRTNG